MGKCYEKLFDFACQFSERVQVDFLLKSDYTKSIFSVKLAP